MGFQLSLRRGNGPTKESFRTRQIKRAHIIHPPRANSWSMLEFSPSRRFHTPSHQVDFPLSHYYTTY